MAQPLQQFQVPDRKRKFNRSSLYTNEYIQPPLNYTVKNWDDCTAYVDYAAGRKEKAKESDDKRRATGERVAANALSRYNYEGLGALSTPVGNQNLGVKYMPEWVSKASADWWLAHERAKADASGNKKQIDYINKWAVQAADLDNNPDTPDNILLFIDVTQGKVKAIDGYQLVPRERKELDRSFYGAPPDRDIRQ
jgi:hypothetical protein